MKLNKSIINSAKYCQSKKNRQFIWDSELPGFGIRIYPSNKKSFVLSYWLKGRKHLFVLGAYGVLTLEQARLEARRTLIGLHDGSDPLQNKRNMQTDNSVRKLAQEFLEKHSKVYKKSWLDDQRRIINSINPAIGSLPVNSLIKSDIIKLHQTLGKTSIYDANRTLTLIGTMLKFGKDWGYLDPMAALPTSGIKKFKELERDRWVTPEEMPRLAEAIDRESNIYIRSAIWLYLLTGLRKSELLSAKWPNVDMERKEIKIEFTKNGSSHYVPLSEAAIALLRRIPKQEFNQYIIIGKKAGSHLVNISKAWNRIKTAAGVEDVRIHDLRRTTGSWLAQNGNSLHLIARVLNHRSSNTTKIYARFGQDHLRAALENHGQEIGSYFTNIDKKSSAS